jgi:hypothetical protein
LKRYAQNKSQEDFSSAAANLAAAFSLYNMKGQEVEENEKERISGNHRGGNTTNDIRAYRV